MPTERAKTPTLQWTHAGQSQQAQWHCERGTPPPTRVTVIDDTMPADVAYRLASNGTALLWQGGFHNARQLLQAMTRRADKPRSAKKAPTTDSAFNAFNAHRALQRRRAGILSALIVRLSGDYAISHPRAPDVRAACTHAWGAADPGKRDIAVSLRELLGVSSAYEWQQKGIEVPALGPAPNNRIYPAYGVFSPVRGEYIALVAGARLPGSTRAPLVAFDIGTGTGVLAAILARRGVSRVIATDCDARAIACAKENIVRLDLTKKVFVIAADMFPEGQADLIVCNPPWLPATPSAPIERTIYDENNHMLKSFISGLAAHLNPNGEGWLILSDFAEHLGLRTREMLVQAITDAGLRVVSCEGTRATHPKAADANDPLYAARAAEVTSLWRLAAL